MTQLCSPPVFEVRSAPEGVVEGYASVFGGVDSYGDTVVPGAYADSLRKHRADKTAPPMLWAHGMAHPVGKWEAMSEDSRGLHVRGRVNLKTQAGADAFEHLRAGDVTGLSIGWTEVPGGSEYTNGVRLLKAVELREVSLVTVPADSAARVTTVKEIAPSVPRRTRTTAVRDPTTGLIDHTITELVPSTIREFEAALQSLGFTRREAARIATKGFEDFDPDPGFNEHDLRALQRALQETMNAMKGIT